jgi:hypothetical protein
MAHIKVQLGPCCTVPFRGGAPVGPTAIWQMRSSDADLDGMSGFDGPPRQARKRRRSRARIESSLQRPAEIRQ